MHQAFAVLFPVACIIDLVDPISTSMAISRVDRLVTVTTVDEKSCVWCAISRKSILARAQVRSQHICF
jgi:hypothetical protein